MKILVTGGAGFIGSHVTSQLLDTRHEVVVYDNLSRGFKHLVDKRAFFVKGSIQEEDKLQFYLEGVTAVIHMAAFIIVPESVEKPKLYYENNCLGTKSLLAAMKKSSVNKIIFSSSATVYGNPDKLPLTENSPLKTPSSPYGQTKLEMEKLIGLEHKEGWLNAVILRYFNPYGPNELHIPETHAIPNFIKAAISKEPITLYWKGEQVRDFIYVEDLAQAHVKTIQEEGLKIYNVGTGKGTKVNDLVATISKIIGYKIKIQDLGERPGDVSELWADSSKIKKEVDWEPKVDLVEGLKKTIDFYRSSSS